ncbi:MAG: hypothetical protein ACRDV9_13150 [Acidimicrobiia bacterium]
MSIKAPSSRLRLAIALVLLVVGGISQPVPAAGEPPGGQGYWVVQRDGTVGAFGGADVHGSPAGSPIGATIVGFAPTPSGQGYWLAGRDGAVFAFGDAVFHGSTGAIRLNQPIVGMAATPTGAGYWLVASDGGIFAFGGARFFGSSGAIRLNQPIVGMAAAPTGEGYWLVAADSGIFAFGGAAFFASGDGRGTNRPAVAMAAVPQGGVGSSISQAEPAPGPDPVERPSPPPPSFDPGPQPSAGAFQVGLIGDTGYTGSQVRTLDEIREDMNRHPLAFVVHDGDIWNQGHPCTDAAYQEMRNTFNGFAHPVIYTPGDNEWSNCEGSTSGKLATVRRLFFPTDETLGQRRLTVTRQHPTFVENARWSQGGVVFATINEPGAAGRGGSHRDANLAWLNATFDEAIAAGSAGVMIAWQDNPFQPSGGRLVKVLKERAKAFGKPVVLVHGDTHDFHIDHPWNDVPGFTRVETFGDTNSGRWVQATVDASNPPVFTFTVMKS